jgi:hypothetical protein
MALEAPDHAVLTRDPLRAHMKGPGPEHQEHGSGPGPALANMMRGITDGGLLRRHVILWLAANGIGHKKITPLARHVLEIS